MTTNLAELRKKSALRWAIAAGAAALVAIVAVTIDVRSSAGDRVSGPAAPGLIENLDDAQRISIVSRDATYRITRTERGWSMTDRGDFPVRADRLHQLTSGLVNLQRVRRMTGDPARHERLGVGDPTQGGNGVLVQIENAQGAFLVNMILGVETQGVYMRTPGEDQVWSVRGDLPPLRQSAAWLDLQPVSMSPDNIRRVDISPEQGAPYSLERNAAGAFAFTGANAGRPALSAATLSGTAQRIAQLQPVDVLPAAAVQGAPMARLRVHTADGAQIDADIIRFEDRPWIKLVARAETPDGQAAANAINARAAAWAYALGQTEYEALAPAITSLLIGEPPSP